MIDMPNVRTVVIYYSSTGTTHALADAAREGAEQEGSEVRFRKVQELAPDSAVEANPGWASHRAATASVEEVSLDDLEWADAVIFASPTRFGLPAAQLKQFMDQTGPLWSQGRLAGKVMTSMTSTATPHGGHESTILAMNNVFYSWGGVIVPPGYADPVQFETGNPYGASATSQDGTVPPSDSELRSARFQASRAVRVARALVAAGFSGDQDEADRSDGVNEAAGAVSR